ncbi:Uncharacterised protein [Mycobacteroides abscessus subsp. massiliense]|nr:Uncharacterised protein [Mycobacteroides abscessus subsp. massiliense]
MSTVSFAEGGETVEGAEVPVWAGVVGNVRLAATATLRSGVCADSPAPTVGKDRSTMGLIDHSAGVGSSLKSTFVSRRGSGGRTGKCPGDSSILLCNSVFSDGHVIGWLGTTPASLTPAVAVPFDEVDGPRIGVVNVMGTVASRPESSIGAAMSAGAADGTRLSAPARAALACPAIAVA